MVWNSVSDFLHMGGYAFYVWGSALTTVIAMSFEVFFLRARRQAVLKMISRQRDQQNEPSDTLTPE